HIFEDRSRWLEDYEILSQLDVKFEDLSQLKIIDDLHSFAIEKNLYVINLNNINYLLHLVGTTAGEVYLNPETSNYTMVLSANSDVMKSYVAENISTYITNVFFELQENTEESEDAILGLLNNQSLKESDRK